MNAARQVPLFSTEETDPGLSSADRDLMAACVDDSIAGLIRRGDIRPNQPAQIITDDEEMP